MIRLKFTIVFVLSVFYSLLSFSVAKKPIQNIDVETFDSIPSEIDGGICCFYLHPNKEQNKGYIMLNDLASTAYMKINHKMEEFILIANSKNVYLYSNKRFHLKVIVNTIKSKQNYEFYDLNGVIILRDCKKRIKKISFYGTCDW